MKEYLKQAIDNKEKLPTYIIGRLISPIYAFLNFLGENKAYTYFFRQRKVSAFNKLYYLLRKNTFDSTYFMGKHILKFPTDLWSYQEIIFEKKPDIIIETGVFLGGSTFFYSKTLELIGNNGKVIATDICLDHADPDLYDLDNVH
jgi:cephalosporin hydroxylase